MSWCSDVKEQIRSNVVEMVHVQTACPALQLALPAAGATAFDICDDLSAHLHGHVKAAVSTGTVLS